MSKELLIILMILSVIELKSAQEIVKCYFAMCDFEGAANNSGGVPNCDPITLIDSSYMYLYGDTSFAMCHDRSGAIECESVAQIDTNYMGSYDDNNCPLGYEQDPENPENCIPTCEFQCPEFSFCTAYNLCICNDGYHLDASLNNTECQAICETKMEQAKCIAPNEWRCNKGYTKSMGMKNGAFLEICERTAVFACKIVSIPVLVAAGIIVFIYIVKLFEKKKMHAEREKKEAKRKSTIGEQESLVLYELNVNVAASNNM